jgi:DNA mismatch repair protein MutL
VKEETDYLNVYGFVGKPETAKKTRGDQYFFVNNRFIKSAYLNHAVMNAYQDMIPADSFPMYVLFIDLNPEQVDVNVHPTKQEIKFEDEKIVYAFIQAAVKHALAQFSITPTLDFELDSSIESLESVQKPFTQERQAATRGSSIFQTFTEANQAHRIESPTGGLKHWNNFVQVEKQESFPGDVQQQAFVHSQTSELVQVMNTYILYPSAQGFLLVHQQSAHERVIYERLIAALHGQPVSTQTSLFPSTIELAAADAVLLNELLPDLHDMGYTIEPFGKNSFVIQGTPADVESGNEKMVLENILEQCKHFSEVKLSKREMLLRSVASQQAVRAGVILSSKEMQRLIEDLFHCQTPNTTPSGKPTFLEFKKEGLEKMFGR